MKASFQADGDVIVVTGGGNGIGRATALRLAQEGAAVAVVDKNGAAAHAVVKELATIRQARKKAAEEK